MIVLLACYTIFVLVVWAVMIVKFLQTITKHPSSREF